MNWKVEHTIFWLKNKSRTILLNRPYNLSIITLSIINITFPNVAPSMGKIMKKFNIAMKKIK